MPNGFFVPSRCYYYLLDWKDRNMDEFLIVTGRETVNQLLEDGFWKAFNHAVEKDLASHSTHLKS